MREFLRCTIAGAFLLGLLTNATWDGVKWAAERAVEKRMVYFSQGAPIVAPGYDVRVAGALQPSADGYDGGPGGYDGGPKE